MGNKESRQQVSHFNLGQGQIRTLLYDKEQGQYIWKAEGKIECETPVTVKLSDDVDFKIKPTAILALKSEFEEWSDYISVFSVRSGFERIEKPALLGNTNNLLKLGIGCGQGASDLIWFQSNYSDQYAFGFEAKGKAIRLMTIKSKNDAVPFSHTIWVLSLKPNGCYLAWRGKHFVNSYQFKPWQY